MRYQLLSCSSDFASSNKIILVMHNQLNVDASNLIFRFCSVAVAFLVFGYPSACFQ